MQTMTAISYPVAETADEALHAPRAFAEREREAIVAAGQPVLFVTEAVGPAFANEAAAEAAYSKAALQPGGWRSLRPVIEAKPAPPRRPVNKDGRRWPEPLSAPGPTLWRLSVSYWRIEREDVRPLPQEAARRLRRDPEAQGLDTRALQALARQPLRPVAPQRALDIGLFEVRLPEAPDRTMPDE